MSSTLGGSFTRTGYVAPAPENFSYDLDGNLTDDGRWHYTWDAENRLTSMETSSAAYGVGAPRQLLSFKYDYLGRRVRKTVANWSGSTYVASVDRKFIYDGWNLLAEYDALTSFTRVRAYLWGLDLTGSLQDGGGVGGLLAVIDTATWAIHQPYYDGNGNVHALVNRSNGTVTAAYEYSAFGETLRATGSFAQSNPFRFSSKYTDDESGLLYYGRRYMSPSQGRFFGRDPIEEMGGLHLYAFVGNNPVNRWDYLGMDDPIMMAAFGAGERDVTTPLPDGCVHHEVWKKNDYPQFEGDEERLVDDWTDCSNSTIPTDNTADGGSGVGSGGAASAAGNPPQAPNNADKCKGLKQRAAVAERVYSTNHANISAGGVYSGYAPGSIDLASLENSAAGLGLGAYGLHKTLSGPWRAGRFPWVSINNQGNLREVGQFGRYSSYAAIGFDTYGAVDSARQGDWTGAGFSAANVGADAAGLIMGGLEYTVAGPVGALVLAGGQFAINSYVFARTTADATANLNANAATAKQSADNALKTLADVKSQMRELGCPP